MWNAKKISVIFPAYNEENNIAEAVSEFLALGIVDEVIVVDNNSKDRTAERAKSVGGRVIHETNQGYGCALRRGLREAKGDILVLCEPDGTFKAADIHKLLAYSDDFDMVLGTRTTQELIWKGANMSQPLRLGNLIVAKFLELIYGGPSLSDCGCTFRLISRAAYEKLAAFLSVKGSHFLPEMVVWGLLRYVRMIEIPVNYKTRVGVSKITGNWKGIIVTAVNMLQLIIMVRIKAIFSPYSLRGPNRVKHPSYQGREKKRD